MSKAASPRPNNAILKQLSAADFALLAPQLEKVDLPLRRWLEYRNRDIEQVYFITSGIASVVATGQGGRSIEAGVIGREGMSGLAVLMQAGRSPHDTYMQLPGSALRMPAEAFRRALEQSPTLMGAVLRFAHCYMVQVAQTAFANGRGKIEERLSRWLLMAHDRIDGDELQLTHEFLALMLSVRRPGVTLAINLLEKQGLIDTDRGAITVLDRKGLEANADGFYGIPEGEQQRLFG